MQVKNPLESLNQKENTWLNTSWVAILEQHYQKQRYPQNLSTIPNNRFMPMEQIFQDINKQMLKITYTLKLSQFFKIRLDLKKYTWQKLKLNIVIKMIPKLNVATMIETLLS